VWCVGASVLASSAVASRLRRVKGEDAFGVDRMSRQEALVGGITGPCYLAIVVLVDEGSIPDRPWYHFGSAILCFVWTALLIIK
jgi:hypothetical protein